MLDTIAWVVMATGTGAATLWGYLKSRRFVRERLRFVGAAHTPAAPFVAGSLAALIAIPVVSIVPIIGIPTALIFGIGIGAGVHHGSRDNRKQLPGP